jgi:hypothetical protein
VTTLRALLTLIQRCGGAPTQSIEAFREDLGDALVDELVRADLLVPGPPRERFPCDRRSGGCWRIVYDNGGDPDRPFVASCWRVPRCCPPLFLTLDQIEQMTVNVEGLVHMLRRLFSVREVGARPMAEPRSLGLAQWGGREREVLFSTQPHLPAVENEMLARRLDRAATLLLAPARWQMSPRMLSGFRAPDELSILFLEDVLDVANGRVRCLDVQREGGGDTAAPPAKPKTRLFLSHEDDVLRPIDADEYDALIARADQFDSFLDTSGASPDCCSAGRRVNEKFERSDLARSRALVICELVARRHEGPLVLSEIEALKHVSHPDQVLEIARRAIDSGSRRGGWGLLQTVPAKRKEPARYHFKPRAGARFAFIFRAE